MEFKNEHFDNILNLLRRSKIDEVRSAYIRLTKELHPIQKSDLTYLGHPSEPLNIILNLRKFADERFWIVLGEAFKVLSPDLLRHIRDYFGERGWKRGDPTYDDYIEAIVNGQKGTPAPNIDLVEALHGRKPDDIPATLYVSLKEIFSGVIKKVPLHQCEPFTRFAKILVPKGCLAGTTFRVPQQTDPKRRLPDFVFMVVDKKDDTFRRIGSDLHMKHDIDLHQSLCGFDMNIRTIDDDELNVVIDDVIDRNYVKVVPNAGAPLPNDDFKRGDLYITFNVRFPKKLQPDGSIALNETDYEGLKCSHESAAINENRNVHYICENL